MRRLGDGFELEAIQNGVITAKREPDAAQLEVKRWGVLVKGGLTTRIQPGPSKSEARV